MCKPPGERSKNRRKGRRSPQSGMTKGMLPEERFAPLVGTYELLCIAMVAGVPEWKLPTDPGIGMIHQWQPEEDRLLLKWPDCVCCQLLPWRTPEAIRSRRRDIGPKKSKNVVDVLVKIARDELARKIEDL
ncbi:hypothetical protein [Maridesulfovibrio sp.]|uniref:hypothetical protein n=1 Tax=Maridesulfovibrio sp. TaxID=2795000 RepID=UPI0029CA0748|nr:hypothetical protein [Maridesulfovibrio sp.]